MENEIEVKLILTIYHLPFIIIFSVREIRNLSQVEQTVSVHCEEFNGWWETSARAHRPPPVVAELIGAHLG